MAHEFKYVKDLRSKIITVLIIVAVILITTYAWSTSSGSYLPAWVITICLAVIALHIMSIPRKIILDDEKIEIRCIVETTMLYYEDIVTIRRLPSSRMKWTIPLFASYGFFGYYGYFIRLKSLDLVKVYAGTWGDWIEIEDISMQKYIVSCSTPEELIRQVRAARVGKIL